LLYTRLIILSDDFIIVIVRSQVRYNFREFHLNDGTIEVNHKIKTNNSKHLIRFLLPEEEVDWDYDVWGQPVKDLTDSDNHRRSRAAQFLCGLAKSDPEKRMLKDFPAVWEVTKIKNSSQQDIAYHLYGK
jgi:hypothetical protein